MSKTSWWTFSPTLEKHQSGSLRFWCLKWKNSHFWTTVCYLPAVLHILSVLSYSSAWRSAGLGCLFATEACRLRQIFFLLLAKAFDFFTFSNFHFTERCYAETNEADDSATEIICISWILSEALSMWFYYRRCGQTSLCIRPRYDMTRMKCCCRCAPLNPAKWQLLNIQTNVVAWFTLYWA